MYLLAEECLNLPVEHQRYCTCHRHYAHKAAIVLRMDLLVGKMQLWLGSLDEPEESRGSGEKTTSLSILFIVEE